MTLRGAFSASSPELSELPRSRRGDSEHSFGVIQGGRGVLLRDSLRASVSHL